MGLLFEPVSLALAKNDECDFPLHQERSTDIDSMTTNGSAKNGIQKSFKIGGKDWRISIFCLIKFIKLLNG